MRSQSGIVLDLADLDIPEAYQELSQKPPELTHIVGVVTFARTCAFSIKSNSFFNRSGMTIGMLLGGCTTETALGSMCNFHSPGISPNPSKTSVYLVKIVDLSNPGRSHMFTVPA